MPSSQEWHALPHSRAARKRRTDVRKHLPSYDANTSRGRLGEKAPLRGYSDKYEAIRSANKRESFPPALAVIYSQLKLARKRLYSKKNSLAVGKGLAIGDTVQIDDRCGARRRRGKVIWLHGAFVGVDRSYFLHLQALANIEVVAAQYVFRE